MKNLYFQKADGSFAVTSLAVEPGNYQSAGDSVVAKGKFPVFVGAFSAGELPAGHIDILRLSGGVVVAKVDVASDLRWKVLRREAQHLLDASNTAAMQAIEEGSANPALSQYRKELRDIINVKPAALLSAINLSAVDAVRPAVLDRPIPR